MAAPLFFSWMRTSCQIANLTEAMPVICLKGRFHIIDKSHDFLRETRRERILENRTKAIKVAEKQAALVAKRKEGENKQNELSQKGCPIAKAEKAFYESIERTKKERDSKARGMEELFK